MRNLFEQEVTLTWKMACQEARDAILVYGAIGAHQYIEDCKDRLSGDSIKSTRTKPCGNDTWSRKEKDLIQSQIKRQFVELMKFSGWNGRDVDFDWIIADAKEQITSVK